MPKTQFGWVCWLEIVLLTLYVFERNAFTFWNSIKIFKIPSNAAKRVCGPCGVVVHVQGLMSPGFSFNDEGRRCVNAYVLPLDFSRIIQQVTLPSSCTQTQCWQSI